MATASSSASVRGLLNLTSTGIQRWSEGGLENVSRITRSPKHVESFDSGRTITVST